MEFKSIKNVSPEGEATMLVYSEIGGDGIDGQYFAEEIAWLQDNAKKINVRINSGGGSIVDGYSMVTSMLNSKIPVHCYIDGLAASMAGLVALCGEKIHMVDYGLFMVHNPSGADEAVLEYFKDTLLEILTKRTGKDSDEISAMMDKETWLNAKECMNMGLVDEIVKTKKKIKIPDGMLNDVLGLMKIYNSFITKTENTKKMDNILNKLSLPDGSDESAVLNSINDLQEQRNKLMEDLENAAREKGEMEGKLVDLENKIRAFEKDKEDAELAAKAAERKKIEELVDSFVKLARIKSEDRDKYINLATNDFDTVKDMLERVGVKKSINIAELINQTAVAPTGKDAWTHRDWEKNDPNGLLKMQKDSPEIYRELYDSYYRKSNA